MYIDVFKTCHITYNIYMFRFIKSIHPPHCLHKIWMLFLLQGRTGGINYVQVLIFKNKFWNIDTACNVEDSSSKIPIFYSVYLILFLKIFYKME